MRGAVAASLRPTKPENDLDILCQSLWRTEGSSQVRSIVLCCHSMMRLVAEISDLGVTRITSRTAVYIFMEIITETTTAHVAL